MEDLKPKIEKIILEFKKLLDPFTINKFYFDINISDKLKNNYIINVNEQHKVNVTENKEQETDQSVITVNTLTPSIFQDINNYDTTEKSDVKESIKEDPHPLLVRGGFLKLKKQNLSNEFSSTSNNFMTSATSEINTTVRQMFNKQSGGMNNQYSTTSMSATSDANIGSRINNQYSATSDINVGNRVGNRIGNKVGGGMNNQYSDTSMSATSDFKVGGGMNNQYSATSMSATSDFKVGGGMNNQYSDTSMSATSDVKVGGGMNNQYSDTSMSATSDVKVGGGMNNQYSATSMSATSDLNTTLKGGFNNMDYSETSQMSNKVQPLNNMNVIRQKLKELENTSNKNIFQKKNQMGGARKLAYIKQTIGINSSSTDSLCE